MLYDRVRLKQDAKAAMAGANPKTWLVTLVFVLLTAAVSGTLGALAPNPLGEYVGALTVGMMRNGSYGLTLGDLLQSGAANVRIGALGLAVVFSLAAVVVSTLFSLLMSYGYSRYALEVYRRETSAGAGSLFKGFPRLPTVVGASVLVGIFSFLWGLLIYGVAVFVAALVLFLTEGSRVMVWLGVACLFVIATLVYDLVTYRYCLTPYFVMDNGKVPALQAISASVQAMKGNAVKRLVLGLSFLGWELLRCLITFVVAAVGGVFAFLIIRGSFGSLPRLGEGPVSYAQMGAGLAVAVALLVIAIVAVLVQLPLELWLMSYENVSYAGFYQLLAGKKEETATAPAPVTGSSYFNNTQPVAPTPQPPEAPAAPSAPEAPTVVTQGPPAAEPPAAPAPYTPFGSSADVAPVTPEVPETPAPPEPPAAPETPETPAPPEAPQPPADGDN